MAVSCKIKILQVEQTFMCHAREFDSPLHVLHWKLFGDLILYMALIL